MKIALIAPPFIAVPPADYGGTELFVAHLAEALQMAGLHAVVYANGESTVATERRWLYERSEWPIRAAEHAWTTAGLCMCNLRGVAASVAEQACEAPRFVSDRHGKATENSRELM